MNVVFIKPLPIPSSMQTSCMVQVIKQKMCQNKKSAEYDIYYIFEKPLTRQIQISENISKMF